MKQSILFGRCAAEGSAFEMGLAYAEQLKKNGLLRRINIVPETEEVTGETLRGRKKMICEIIPGLEEEVAGVCEGMKVREGRLFLFQQNVAQAGRCSQIAALPAVTEDGHLYVARSYEYGFEDELCLMVTRIQGKPAHAGFSLALFGRMDGMNEHGLCVTMSTCSFLQPASGEGVWFPVVLRALLDRCATVEEASYLLKQLPLRTNDTILLADSAGNARVAEIFCSETERHVSFRDAEDFLVATNHYQNPDMLQFDNHRNRHSVRRWRTACDTLQNERGHIAEASLKTLLETKMPKGVCCPYYGDGLGTLRSMLFDVSAGTLQVCFGAPERELWQEVSLREPAVNSVFEIAVTNAEAKNPREFWKFLAPGDLDEDWKESYQ